MKIPFIATMAVLLLLTGCGIKLNDSPIPPTVDYTQFSSDALLKQYGDEIDLCAMAVDKVIAYANSSSTSYTSTYNSELKRTDNGYKHRSSHSVDKSSDDLATGLLTAIDSSYTKSSLGLDLRARETCRNMKYQTDYIYSELNKRNLTDPEKTSLGMAQKHFELVRLKYERHVVRGRK